jgi:hypothetical protein
VYKTAEEIEEETGLTYKEQRYVRKLLTRLGFISETYKRTSHKLFFKFNVETFMEWLNSKGEQNLGICPKVSSGNDLKADGEMPKGKFDIQRIQQENTTENLATPFEDISKENLRAYSKGNKM